MAQFMHCKLRQFKQAVAIESSVQILHFSEGGRSLRGECLLLECIDELLLEIEGKMLYSCREEDLLIQIKFD